LLAETRIQDLRRLKLAILLTLLNMSISNLHV